MPSDHNNLVSNVAVGVHFLQDGGKGEGVPVVGVVEEEPCAGGAEEELEHVRVGEERAESQAPETEPVRVGSAITPSLNCSSSPAARSCSPWTWAR